MSGLIFRQLIYYNSLYNSINSDQVWILPLTSKPIHTPSCHIISPAKDPHLFSHTLTTFFPLFLNHGTVFESKRSSLIKPGYIKPDDNISEILKADLNKGFRLLVEKYSSRLYWHIRRLVILHEDADDALQNTFVNVWKSIGEFRNESSLYTWMYTIATNEALSLINRRKKNAAIPIDDLESHFANSLEGSTWFDGDEAQVRLQNAILKLPQKQRIVFNLKYFDDMTYEEMSRILNTSVGALKASYHHAVKKIEILITAD